MKHHITIRLATIISALFLALALSACAENGANGSSTDSATAETITVTDGAGRENTIPACDKLTKVYCTSPIAEVAMFAFAPEKLAGVNSDYSESALQYLPEGTGDLPNYGTWAMGGTIDQEALMRDGVQVILSVSNSEISDGDISSAQELQDATGIPVLLFDGSVENTPDTYREIGAVLGQEERGEELAQWCEKAKADTEAAIATIPEDQRVRVYYAEGPDGLKTEPQTSPHFTTFAVGGAISVAECDMNKGSGMSEVSLENVIAWNPDVIISWSTSERGGASETIRSNPDWASISAVQNDQVYAIPDIPFMWGDRPPSVTRYLGMQWIANKLYPNAYDIDMIDVTKDFYSKFFSVQLTDEQANQILSVQ